MWVICYSKYDHMKQWVTGSHISLKLQYLLDPAVGSRDDPLVIDEGAPTEVVADVDWDLPGLGVRWALISTNNLIVHWGSNWG